MKINLTSLRNWQILLLVFCVYNSLFVIFIPPIYIANAQSPQPVEWWILMARPAISYNLWCLYTPVILWIGYHLRLTKPHFWRNLSLHILISILTGILNCFVYSLGVWTLGLSKVESLQAALFNPLEIARAISGAMAHYPAIIAAQHAYLFFRESQEGKFRLQETELRVLKAQLNPHFLFNTLNAISALVYRSPKDADRTITQLSDLLRISLKSGKTQEISLKEELDFLRTYLQIHQTLMRKRLEVQWKIDPETLNATVPNLILQPLVENSIQHGLSPLESGGCIEISAERQNGSLLLQVRDNGLGLSVNENLNKGIGLSNTEARLNYLYGDAHEFKLNDSPGGAGVTVNMKIPFREQARKEKNENSNGHRR